MADPADKISQLKIDRSMPAAAERRWLLPGIIVTIVGAVAVWWIFFSAGSSTVLAETDIARKPPSAAAANPVLDASGYVVARRQATVSSKVTGKVGVCTGQATSSRR